MTCGDQLADQIANLGYPVGMGMAPHPDAVAKMRNSIIEECAKVVERYAIEDWVITSQEIAAVIRALKDKP